MPPKGANALMPAELRLDQARLTQTPKHEPGAASLAFLAVDTASGGFQGDALKLLPLRQNSPWVFAPVLGGVTQSRENSLTPSCSLGWQTLLAADTTP